MVRPGGRFRRAAISASIPVTLAPNGTNTNRARAAGNSLAYCSTSTRE
jgi:hypothetical protein